MRVSKTAPDHFGWRPLDEHVADVEDDVLDHADCLSHHGARAPAGTLDAATVPRRNDNRQSREANVMSTAAHIGDSASGLNAARTCRVRTRCPTGSATSDAPAGCAASAIAHNAGSARP